MRGTEYLQSNKFGKSNCLFLKDTKFWMSKKKFYSVMGRVKALMMEMEEHGYDFLGRGEKYVCSHHFEDKYLNGYIKKHGETGVCSYCGHNETVIDMSDLADHIGMTISVYFNDVDSECLPLASSYFDDEEEQIPGIKRAGCFAVPENAEIYEDTSEMMEDLGLHTDCDSLNDDIDHLFEDNMWIKKNPFELWWNEEMELQWKRFAEMVKHSRRFTFLAMPKVSGSENILEELNEVILHTDGVVDLTALPTDVSIWMDKWEGIAFLKSFHKDITQPLLKEAKEAIEYVPSQIFTEYLRWMFTDKQGRYVDGLVYKSCKTKKANIVLFCNNEESREWVKLDSFSGEK